MNILLTVDELAKYLKIKPDTIYKKVRRGELPAIKLGKLVRFRKDMIDQWISEQAAKTIEAVEHKVEEAVKEVRKKAKIASKVIPKVMHDVPEMIEDVKNAPLNKKQEAFKKGLKTIWKDLSSNVSRGPVRVRKKTTKSKTSKKASVLKK